MRSGGGLSRKAPGWRTGDEIARSLAKGLDNKDIAMPPGWDESAIYRGAPGSGRTIQELPKGT
jgi:hypothetical protein